MSKKDKFFYWFWRLSGIITACLCPIYAVIEHFPIWLERNGTGRTLGVGAILILIILAVVFRKTVINYFREKFKTHTFPPVMGWIVLLCIAYVLQFINAFIIDMTAVFWAGLVGGLIGSFFMWLADRIKRKGELNEQP